MIPPTTSTSSTERGRRVAGVAVAIAAAVGVALPHGASKGLHLHLVPQAAVPGSKVTVLLDASREIEQVTVGFAGAAPAVLRLKPAARHVELQLTVPPDVKPGMAVSVHAEARAAALVKPLRASSLLVIGDPKQPIVLR